MSIPEGATVSTSRLCKKYRSDVIGKHEVKELQNAAILGTARVLGEVLMWEMLLHVP